MKLPLPQLIEDWHQGWRWYSVHALVVAGVIPAAWSAMPVDWQALMPAWCMAALSGAIAVSGIIGRLVDQAKP